MTRLLPLLALLHLSISPATAALGEADETPWYRVELLVFSQPQADLNSEYWPVGLPAGFSENAIQLSDVPGRAGDVQLLPAQALQLPVNRALMQRQGYRTLFHRAWQQPLRPRDQARAIRISGGQRFANDRRELDGEIHLNIARYLHLQTNLFFTLRTPPGWQSPYLPSPAPLAANDAAADERLNPVSASTPESGDAGLLTVQMQQSRRMRGSQLHYLDHPLFGLMIKLTPMDAAPR